MRLEATAPAINKEYITKNSTPLHWCKKLAFMKHRLQKYTDSRDKKEKCRDRWALIRKIESSHKNG